MANGFGGDCPENNIEALIALQKDSPKAKELIMVADNWARIKDKTLIGKIKKPVRIILCGVNKNAINVDYLNLAYKTNGSVHTIERDIKDLNELKVGSTFKFNSTKYILTKTGFVIK